MNGSIAAIVTMGFGSWGSPSLVLTIGYGTTETGPPVSRIETTSYIARRRESASTIARREESTSTIARRVEN